MTLALGTAVRALFATGLMLGVVIGAVVALAMVRRRFLQSKEEAPTATMPLHQIRTMRKNNEISEEEFEQLRSAALAGWGVSTSDGSAGADAVVGETHESDPRRTENLSPPALGEEQ